MATASELMSYTGNAGLGLGSNADVPVSPSKPLDFVNTVIRDIAARDFQKNIIKYDQQVKDRDKMMEALSSGAVKVGDILQEDMAIIKQVGDKQLEAFKKWMQKGYGDIDAATEYKRATREFQDAVTQAEMRKLVDANEGAKIAGEKIPKYAEVRRAHLDKFKKGDFYGNWNPFQETNRLNIGEILALPKARTEEVVDPKRPFEKGKRTYFDWEDTRKALSNYSTTPEGLYNLQLFKEGITSLPGVELIDKIKLTNQTLRQRGIPEIVATQMPNGQWEVNEKLDELAAKFAIAAQPKMDETVWEFDKVKSDRDIDLKRVAATNYSTSVQDRHNKAMETIARDRLTLDKGTAGNAKTEDILGADAVITTVVENMKKSLGIGGFFPNWLKSNSIPFSDPTILKDFSQVVKDGEGKYVTPKSVTYNKGRDQIDITYITKDENDKDVQNVQSMNGRDYMTMKVRQTFPNKDIGTINNIVSDVYQRAGGSLYELSQNYGKGKPSQTISLSDIPVGAKVTTKDGKNYYDGKEIIE